VEILLFTQLFKIIAWFNLFKFYCPQWLVMQVKYYHTKEAELSVCIRHWSGINDDWFPKQQVLQVQASRGVSGHASPGTALDFNSISHFPQFLSQNISEKSVSDWFSYNGGDWNSSTPDDRGFHAINWGVCILELSITRGWLYFEVLSSCCSLDAFRNHH